MYGLLWMTERLRRRTLYTSSVVSDAVVERKGIMKTRWERKHFEMKFAFSSSKLFNSSISSKSVI